MCMAKVELTIHLYIYHDAAFVYPYDISSSICGHYDISQWLRKTVPNMLHRWTKSVVDSMFMALGEYISLVYVAVCLHTTG